MKTTPINKHRQRGLRTWVEGTHTGICGPMRFNAIDVSVDYYIGGWNWGNGVYVPRGYRLHVQPLEVGDGIVSFTGYSGTALSLAQTKRFSTKALDAQWKEIEPVVPMIVDEFIKGESDVLRGLYRKYNEA